MGNPHHFCECVILPNHLHEIYEVFVVTGNSPLRTFHIQQDEATVRSAITAATSGPGKRLNRSSTTKTVEAQTTGERRSVELLLSRDLDISRPHSLRQTLGSRLPFHDF
jgi:hypothetical protein